MISYTKNATVSRIRALYGKRLLEADYKELAGKRSVAEAAEYLKKNTHYGEALSNINTATIHRGYLETIIRRYSFDRYVNICDFQQLRKESFFNYLIVLSEIREILSIILHMNAGSSEEYITAMPAYLIKKSSFNLIEAAKTRKYKELLSILKHTPYYNVLKNIPSDENGKADYLRCEISLRTYYYSWLTEIVKKNFSDNICKEILDLIYIQVDMSNIINAYRMKKYYGLSAVEIEKRMLPFHNKLNEKKRRELFEHDSSEKFLNAFSKTYYGKNISFENENEFELEIRRLESVKVRKSLVFSQNAAVSVFSFVYLLDTEVKNIITIIEGIRYKRSTESIINSVVII